MTPTRAPPNCYRKFQTTVRQAPPGAHRARPLPNRFWPRSVWALQPHSGVHERRCPSDMVNNSFSNARTHAPRLGKVTPSGNTMCPRHHVRHQKTICGSKSLVSDMQGSLPRKTGHIAKLRDMWFSCRWVCTCPHRSGKRWCVGTLC